jgi:hypothetical protein
MWRLNVYKALNTKDVTVHSGILSRYLFGAGRVAHDPCVTHTAHSVFHSLVLIAFLTAISDTFSRRSNLLCFKLLDNSSVVLQADFRLSRRFCAN